MQNKIFRMTMSFILGVLVTIAVGVVAYEYNSNNISYKHSGNNWNVDNVKSAIDYLKGQKINSVQNINHVYYAGNLSNHKQISKNLSNGRYIVTIMNSISGSSVDQLNKVDDYFFNSLLCSSNNCTINELSRFNYDKTPSNLYYHKEINGDNEIYYVEIKNQQDTVIFDFTGENWSDEDLESHPMILNMQIARLN